LAETTELQHHRLCGPDLHRARGEVTVCTATDYRACTELTARPRKIADLAQCVKIGLQEQVPRLKLFEFAAQLLVFGHRAMETSSANPEIDDEIDGSFGDHRHWLDESPQP
jgi:hypothetical protein